MDRHCNYRFQLPNTDTRNLFYSFSFSVSESPLSNTHNYLIRYLLCLFIFGVYLIALVYIKNQIVLLNNPNKSWRNFKRTSKIFYKNPIKKYILKEVQPHSLSSLFWKQWVQKGIRKIEKDDTAWVRENRSTEWMIDYFNLPAIKSLFQKHPL